MNYISWHQKLRKLKGKPEVCVGCGNKAQNWALKEEHRVPGARVHIEDPECYQSMCTGCHAKQDKLGVPASPQAVESMRAAQKKSFEDPARLEAHQVVIEAARSEEAKAKRLESLRNYWSNPENRKKASEAQRKRFEDPEQKRQQRERMLKAQAARWSHVD
jgi:hypothetical protein